MNTQPPGEPHGRSRDEGAPEWRQSGSGPAAHLAAGAVFACMALAWTFPLAAHLTTHIPGTGPGDNVAALWMFWWMRFALLHHADPFFTTHLFAPGGTSLALHTGISLPAFAGATLLRPLPLIAAHNVMLLCTLFLNAMCAYWLIRRVTRDWWAAILGAVVFGGSPFIDGHLLGHFNVLSAWTLPLVCLAAIETANGSRRWAIALGVLVGATTYLDYYDTLFAMAVAAVLVPLESRDVALVSEPSAGPSRIRAWVAGLIAVDLALIGAILVTGGFGISLGPLHVSASGVFNPLQGLWMLIAVWAWVTWRPRVVVRQNGPAPWTWSALGSAVVIAALVASPLLLRILNLAVSGDYVAQTFYWRSGPQGVDLATLVSGNPFSWWSGGWARWLGARFPLDLIEGDAWPGVVPVVLTCVAWRRGHSSEVRRWTVLGAVAFIWALGPHLFVAGHNTGLMLPNAVLRYLPIVSNARIPGRAMVVVYLALAILSAQGLAALRRQGMGWAWSCALLGCLLVDFAPTPFPLLALDRPPAYELLRGRPESGAVLELPLGIRDGFGEAGALDHRVLWYQTIHERPLVGGFVARLPSSVRQAYEADPLIRGLLRLSSREPQGALGLPNREGALQALHAWHIRFLVLNRKTASAELVRFVHQLSLTPVGEGGEREMFMVGDER